jgi:septal ring factor EnvC (AmiA/AmiB activator)
MDIFALKNSKKRSKDLGAQYAKVLDRHAEIERQLARVMNRWQKSRAALKRVEKKLDEAQAVAWTN